MVSKIKLFFAFAILSLFLSSIGIKPATADGGAEIYTPASVAGSIYKIQAYQNGEPQWSGSGWMIGKDRMVTAGHVCDTEDQDGFTFRAISQWNKEYPISVIKFSRDPDLCLIEAKYVPVGIGLNQRAKTPAYGDELWYSGAPHGIFGDGVLPFAKGFYIGNNHMMIAGYPGASGSVVYTRDGVVGVLVAGFRGTHVLVFEPAWALAQFLRE